MKHFCVYILRCNDGSYYTGVTSNLEKRLNDHFMGADPNCYTYTRRPFLLVFNEFFADTHSAMRAEKQIKGWRREKKEALINGDFELLVALSNRRVHPSTGSG